MPMQYWPTQRVVRRQALASHRTRHLRAPGSIPEWMTEAWNQKVEAEARHRLKRKIHGVRAR